MGDSKRTRHEESIVSCRYGELCVPNRDDLILNAMRKYGEWAQKEIEVFAQIIHPGATVIDAGAFVGTHSRAFSQMVGKEGKVLAFEPNPASYKYLRENAALSQYANITTYQAALGNRQSFGSLSQPDQNLGGAHISEGGIDSKGAVVPIHCLDDFDFSKVNFIKADLEGMEFPMLLGAEKTVARYHPRIFLEVNNLQASVPVLDWANARDYTMFGLISPAFNPDNVNGVVENIFGEAVECGLLLIHRNELAAIESVLSAMNLPVIDSTDGLALLLLHKPQYFYEVLEGTLIAKSLGLDFPLPPVRKLVAQVVEREGQIASLSQGIVEREGQIASLSQGIVEREGQIAATLSSTSWQLTMPMRRLGDQLKRIGKGFRLLFKEAAQVSRTSTRTVAEVEKNDGLHLIRRSRLFDPRLYLQENPDVAQAGVDPAWHYLYHGWRENRDPSPHFSSRWYLHTYEDVATANINPLVHYLRYGRKEKRLPKLLTQPTCLSGNTLQNISRNSSIWRACAAALRSYHREGLAGVKNRFKQLWTDTQPNLGNIETAISLPASDAAKKSSAVKGSLFPKEFHWFLERVEMIDGWLVIEGWAFHENKRISSAILCLNKGHSESSYILSCGHHRGDVSKVYSFDNAYCSGFWGSIRVPSHKDPASAFAASLHFCLEDGEKLVVTVSAAVVQSSCRKKHVLLLRALTRSRVVNAWKMLLRGDVRNFVSYAKRGIRRALGDNFVDASLSDMDLPHLFYQEEPKFDPLDKEIDIIVPIYNGLQLLLNLFQSIITNTTSQYRLILIDDCSTDPGVWPLLEKIKKERPNTILMRNMVNKGFVASVNLGAQQAQNDFVLLNTDVEVPKYWLERLMRPICDDVMVASTTPFTNAGTICSFPSINKDNSMFLGLDVGSVDAWFRRARPENIRIELPTAVGFCMGVNINAWKVIGSFDEKAFGRGYGEENDWCIRGSTAGYYHLMVPNLFIYHKHGGVFGEEKKELMQKNLEKLQRRYPDYQSRVEDFIKRDPAAHIRQLLCLQLATHYAVKTILIIDHEIGGGANTYRDRLINEHYASTCAVLLLTRDPVLKVLKLRCLFADYEITMLLSEPDQVKQLLGYVKCHEIFYNNLVSFGHPLDIVKLLTGLKKTTDIKITIAIHDFFPLCPSYNLLNLHGKFCALPDLERCKVCLPNNTFAEPVGTNDIAVWRSHWRELFLLSDTVLCFSESSQELVGQVYPFQPGQALLRPHSVPIFAGKKPRLNFSKPLNIGVVGAINYAKGSDVVNRMASLLAEEYPDVRMTVIGILNDTPVHKNLTVTGSYQRDELAKLIEKHCVNMLFLPSICPETFSYVTSELMQLEVPLCCFDLGAPAERVKKYELGCVISEIEPAAAVSEIIAFYDRIKTKALVILGDKASGPDWL